MYVQFSKTSPLKSGESSKKSSGENRVKSCHVCGCHSFFGPDIHIHICIYTHTLEFVLRLLRTLLGPCGWKAPAETLSDALWGIWARRGRETPVRGGQGCKSRVEISPATYRAYKRRLLIGGEERIHQSCFQL